METVQLYYKSIDKDDTIEVSIELFDNLDVVKIIDSFRDFMLRAGYDQDAIMKYWYKVDDIYNGN